MTPELLEQVGIALYGSTWIYALGAALETNPRTVRRWRAGTSPIPSGISKELFEFCEQRIAVLEDLAGSLEVLKVEDWQKKHEHMEVK